MRGLLVANNFYNMAIEELVIISQVDFLKFIFKKHQENKLVTVSEIASEFNIKTPSVTQALRSMTLKNWLLWEPRKAIRITKLGKSEALKLIRKHRILECFLFKIMQLDLWQVHEEAERLEHVVSDSLISKMNDLCGNPKYDPHGHGIPNLSGKFPKAPNFQKLSEIDLFQNRKVCLIDDRHLVPMRELVKKKIVIGTEIQKLGKNKFFINGKNISLTTTLIDLIGVESV